jgi:hypothetical protein
MDHVENKALLFLGPTVALLRICYLATGTYLPSRCPGIVAVYRVIAWQRLCTPQYVDYTD